MRDYRREYEKVYQAFTDGTIREREAAHKLESILDEAVGHIHLNTNLSSDEGAIVSLTSIVPRLDRCVYAIFSIIIQSIQPNRIVLWLDQNIERNEENYSSLKRIREIGVEIKYVDDIGPHTKYYYALQEYRNNTVITVDDDIMYQPGMIEGLLSEHYNHPHCVIAYQMWIIRCTVNGVPYPTNDYYVPDNEVSGLYDKGAAPLGVGGVLYPPACFSVDSFNEKKIKNSFMKNDDIWLMAREHIEGINIYKVRSKFRRYVHSTDTQDIALRNDNLLYRNDIYMRNAFLEYDLASFFIADRNKILNHDIRLMEKWIEYLQDNGDFTDYLLGHSIHSIAIYGWGRKARLFYRGVCQDRIRITCIMDIRADEIHDQVHVIHPDEYKNDADIVVVAASVKYGDIIVYDFSKMISIEDMLVNIWYENRIVNKK